MSSAYRFAGILLCAAVVGCASTTTTGYRMDTPIYDKPVAAGEALKQYIFDPAWENRVLALDPDNVTGDDVAQVLSKGPAPRIVNIHGGVYPVQYFMINFSEFLTDMGYPAEMIRKPRNGEYSYSCYFDSGKIAGLVAWYYEKEAMPLVLVGHSQGGMQIMKVLHQLAGGEGKQDVRIWNPMTEKFENRSMIMDPFTGEEKKIKNVIPVGFTSVVGTGGATRILPNQWNITTRLRQVPDSTQRFDGFYQAGDFLGGDLLGLAAANRYSPIGKAAVRSVALPKGHDHVTAPVSRHLSQAENTRRWVDAYRPGTEQPPAPRGLTGSTKNIVWAAENWYAIKRNWCLAVQELIRQKRTRA